MGAEAVATDTVIEDIVKHRFVLHIYETQFLQDKMLIPFSDEQRRCVLNLAQHYDVWMEAERASRSLAYGMRWVERSGRQYLYEFLDRKGNAKSLGARSPTTESVLADYDRTKTALDDRLARSKATLGETCRLYRALRLPTIASKAAAILREADRRELLGSHLLVVGTNAMPAYALEAGGRIEGAPDQTDDFDMAWTALRSDGNAIWQMLQAVDGTYTVNTEKTFQARNADAYEVEFLAAPSRMAGVHRTDRPRPIDLPEQEWLLLGKTQDHVVVGLDGSPARLVVPDPRWFALQKLWMSRQEKRNPLKRPKDSKQAIALLDVVAEHMPHLPMDDSFERDVPDALKSLYEEWKAATSANPTILNW